MKRISIITINRNNAAGLRKTLASVAEQTCGEYEQIVIDGASTDDSVDVIQEYARYIKYWVSESDSGVYNAMNKGISAARGEYCLFINSGDWLFDDGVVEKLSFTKKWGKTSITPTLGIRAARTAASPSPRESASAFSCRETSTIRTR